MKIRLTDTTLRDAHQSLWATRMRTDDILAQLGARKSHQFLCGFSMETQDVVANSRAKLVHKNLDMIVANSLRTAGAGFGTDTNVVTLITADAETELPLMSKDAVAHRILDEIKARMGSADSRESRPGALA